MKIYYCKNRNLILHCKNAIDIFSNMELNEQKKYLMDFKNEFILIKLISKLRKAENS